MCKRRSVASRFLQERNGFLCQCPRCQAEGFSPSEESGAHRHPTEVAFEKKKDGLGTGERGRGAENPIVPVQTAKRQEGGMLEFWQKMSEIRHRCVVLFSPPFFFHGLFNLTPPTYRPHEGFVTSSRRGSPCGSRCDLAGSRTVHVWDLAAPDFRQSKSSQQLQTLEN